MFKITPEKCRFVFLLPERGFKLAGQVGQIIWQEVGQVAIFAMVPNLLGRIEFRSVGRKPLSRKPIRVFCS